MLSHNGTDQSPSAQFWETMERISLLDGTAPGTNEYSHEAHLGQMIGLLGPPPRKLLDRAPPDVYSRYFDKKGELESTLASLCY
jgi:hypothetical protein